MNKDVSNVKGYDMSTDLGTVAEEFEDDEDDEGESEECYGEYGRTPLCKECPYAEKCKKFKNAEKTLVKKYKGKYTSRGKEKGTDRY